MKFKDALKYLGTKVNGVEPKGYYVTDIIKSIADDYHGGQPSEKFTLTYAMGEYADGGSVPEAVTVNSGESININFDTHPTREGYNFVGWAAGDGQEIPEYSEDGATSITLYNDVTLYPAFVEVVPPQPSDYITIDNTDGGVEVVVEKESGKDYETVLTVSAGERATFNYELGENYALNLNGSVSSASATFNGTYGGNSYTDQSLEIDGSKIMTPDESNLWTDFVSGDSGTMAIVSVANE